MVGKEKEKKYELKLKLLSENKGIMMCPIQKLLNEINNLTDSKSQSERKNNILKKRALLKDNNFFNENEINDLPNFFDKDFLREIFL